MVNPRPDWFRLDTSFRRNPKIDELSGRGATGWQAVVLWLDGVAYSTHHLTDGFIPKRWPTSNGYSQAAVDLLVRVELWHQALDLMFDGADAEHSGYLINDYHAYQVARAQWTETGAKRRDASAKAHAARYGRKQP